MLSIVWPVVQPSLYCSSLKGLPAIPRTWNLLCGLGLIFYVAQQGRIHALHCLKWLGSYRLVTSIWSVDISWPSHGGPGI